MNKDTILSLIRHAVTAGGAMLTAKGIGDEATWTAVGGGVMALVGFFLFRKAK